MFPSGLAVICFLLLINGVRAFEILPGTSLNHQEITEQALLKATVQACRVLALNEGTNFNSPAQPYTAESVAAACGAEQSSKTFRQAIRTIMLRNIRVDVRYALNASFHFDKEMFVQGRGIITEGLIAVKASNRIENFEAARQTLGEIMHPLQDFYSHSNWVELGKTLPNSNLIKSGANIGNIAGPSRATCRNCNGDDCTNNILEDIIDGQILTSGYFGVIPVISTKPSGKCSHGGKIDQTSNIEPTGGINKDSFKSSHGNLHTRAASLAIAASSQLLEDIRMAAGERPFLQMVGISKGASKALCFVTDTSKSMSDDIAVVKTVTTSIIDGNVGTENEPAAYILVPFSDPGFGPLIRTTDTTLFKDIVNHLTATGGGDNEGMSLSGLQLALCSAPFNSEIFLFTDAPAKDKDLKNAVIALIERTQTVVNFMITDTAVTNRRKRRNNNHQPQTRLIAESDAQLYKDMAQASGGQAIEVTKAQLPAATTIIVQSISTSLVTLLQASRNPGQTNSFSFIVDDTITNPTVYITGRSLTFTLTSPTGTSQLSTDSTGSLITSTQSVGNFITLQLQKQVGQWEIRMVSNNPYTLRVVGQSVVDFLFNFVELSQGPFGGFDALDTRPRSGGDASLLVTITGSDSATVTEVALVESTKGSNETMGVVSQQDGNFFVQVDVMPTVEFVVRVKGRLQGSSSDFQRQSSTNFRTSNLTITASAESILIPGSVFSVPFFVTSKGSVGNVSIRATNSRGFDSTFPDILLLESENSTSNGTVTLSAPLNTPSGSDVILIIDVEAPDGSDSNYIVLRLSILNSFNDFTYPACQLLSLQSNCTEICNQSTWDLYVRVSDGAGVDRVSLLQGNGTFNTRLEAGNNNAVLVSYIASCCAPEMKMLVVDQAGNVGSCQFTARDSVSATASLSFLVFLIILALGQLILTDL